MKSRDACERTQEEQLDLPLECLLGLLDCVLDQFVARTCLPLRRAHEAAHLHPAINTVSALDNGLVRAVRAVGCNAHAKNLAKGRLFASFMAPGLILTKLGVRGIDGMQRSAP